MSKSFEFIYGLDYIQNRRKTMSSYIYIGTIVWLLIIVVFLSYLDYKLKQKAMERGEAFPKKDEKKVEEVEEEVEVEDHEEDSENIWQEQGEATDELQNESLEEEQNENNEEIQGED